MKKFSIFLALLLLFSVSCRKKVERDYKLVSNAGPLQCSNLIFDGDELGTDCGGADCATCEVNEAPCINPNNKIYIHNGVVGQTFSVTSTATSQTNGSWTFNAYTGGGTSKYLQLIFGSKPNVLTTYMGTDDSLNLESNEVYIMFYDPVNGDKIGTGQVYIVNNSGVYNIAACDYSFHEIGQSAPAEAQWFNVSFN